MATPNYGFEKRQKELAKKRKKEEKLKEKAARKQGAAQAGSEAPTDQEEPANAADAESGEAGVSPGLREDSARS